MHPTGPELTPSERLREIAAIFASGILRLATCPQSTPESVASGQEGQPESPSDSAQKSLDLPATQSPHVPAG